MSLSRFLIILFFIIFSPLQAQQSVIDSLQIELNQTANSEIKAKILIEIGSRYFRTQVYFDSAFFYTEKAYDLSKEHNIEELQAHALFNLGNINNSLNNYKESIDYYSRSKDLLVKLDKPNQVGSAYNNIGGSYFELGDYDKAIEYYENALEIAVNEKDTINMGIDYMNIGEAQFKLGDLAESKNKFQLALELLSKAGVDPPTVHLFYGRTLFALREIEEAEKQGLTALELSKRDNDLYYTVQSSSLLADIFSEKKDFKNAYLHQQYAMVYGDSLNTAKEVNEIEKLKLNFELNRNKKELAFLSQENKYLNTIYLLGAIGLLFLIVLIFRQIKIIRMTKAMHDVQKRLVQGELEKRELLKNNRNATAYDAAIEQDKELRDEELRGED